jgi:hypothetical protein
MQTPVRTTELSAVNVMLSLMGNSPINSLSTPYGADVAQARNLLGEVSLDVQTEGFQFNTEEDYTLVRDANNKIPVPTNAIAIDAKTDWSSDVVFRAGYLYDRKNHTDVFDHDVHCEITFAFAFDELPETMRRYVMIAAARKLQVRFLGSEQQEAFTRDDETRARVRMLQDQGNTADVNIFADPRLAYMTRSWGPTRRFWR